MPTPKTVKKACRVLRSRLEFDDAHFTLPDSPDGQDDTVEIMEATDLYFRTWIYPVIDAIESGDMAKLQELTKHD